MKRCVKCDNWIDNDSNFCEHCGTEQTSAPYTPTVNKSQSTLGIVALVLSIAVTAIGGLICGIIDVNNKNGEKKGLAKAAIIISSIKIFFRITIIVLYIIFGAGFISGITDGLAGGDNPSKYGITIHIDDSSKTITKKSEDGEVTAKISKIEFEADGVSINDTVNIEVEYLLEMTENTTSNKNAKIELTVKLINGDGIIVQTITDTVGPMSKGEKMQGEFYFCYVDEDEHYTVVIE